MVIKGEKLIDLHLYSDSVEVLPNDVEIIDNKLIIYLTSKEQINRITLGYKNAPEHNLYNSSGYLASPFELKLN